MCVDLFGYAIYRMFYPGLVWTEYDMEKVVFHYSRKEEYRFRWEEIPGNQVQVERAGGGYIFYIQGKGLLLKKLPLLKVDVGKVCKTCGGSGYVPK